MTRWYEPRDDEPSGPKVLVWLYLTALVWLGSYGIWKSLAALAR